MAQKKVPSIEDAIKYFKDIVTRASLSNYYYVDNIINCKNNSSNTILVIPDKLLWDKLTEDEDWKKENNFKEADVSKPDEANIASWAVYARSLEEDWINIETDADLSTGKLFKIKINDYEYKVSINRDLMPMKLKKSEYEGVSYKVFLKPLHILAIKKRFDSAVTGCGFTVVRLFQII